MSTGSISLTESAYYEDSVIDLDYSATNHYLLSGRVPEHGGMAACRKAGEAHGVPQRYDDAVDSAARDQRTEMPDSRGRLHARAHL